MLGGAVTGAIVSLFTPPAAAILLGWDTAVVVYLAWVWGAVWRLDPHLTAQLAKREDNRDDFSGIGHEYHVEAGPADSAPSRTAFLPIRRGAPGDRNQRGRNPAQVTRRGHDSPRQPFGIIVLNGVPALRFGGDASINEPRAASNAASLRSRPLLLCGPISREPRSLLPPRDCAVN
jgi:hypothetical protein